MCARIIKSSNCVHFLSTHQLELLHSIFLSFTQFALKAPVECGFTIGCGVANGEMHPASFNDFMHNNTPINDST